MTIDTAGVICKNKALQSALIRVDRCFLFSRRKRVSFYFALCMKREVEIAASPNG